MAMAAHTSVVAGGAETVHVPVHVAEVFFGLTSCAFILSFAFPACSGCRVPFEGRVTGCCLCRRSANLISEKGGTDL